MGRGRRDALVRRPDNELVPTRAVTADTLAWRAEADRIMAYWNERLIVDRRACVLTSEVLDDFNSWLDGNGHNRWSKELFGPRLKGHELTTGNGVTEKRTANPRGLGRRPGIVPGWPTVKQPVV